MHLARLMIGVEGTGHGDQPAVTQRGQTAGRGGRDGQKGDTVADPRAGGTRRGPVTQPKSGVHPTRLPNVVKQLVYALQRLLTPTSMRTRVTDTCIANHRLLAMTRWRGRGRAAQLSLHR